MYSNIVVPLFFYELRTEKPNMIDFITLLRFLKINKYFYGKKAKLRTKTKRNTTFLIIF